MHHFGENAELLCYSLSFVHDFEEMNYLKSASSPGAHAACGLLQPELWLSSSVAVLEKFACHGHKSQSRHICTEFVLELLVR